MTVETFMHEVEGYYGKYTPVEKKYVAQWAAKRSDEERKQVFYLTLKSFSNRWGKAPDIAVLEESLKQYRAGEREKTQGPVGQDPHRLYEPEVLQIEEKPTEEQVQEYFRELDKITRKAAGEKNYRRAE